MTTYKLNADKAKSSDTPANSRINETGAYKGIFTIAKKITANSGTQGIEFNFQDESGATANWLRLYTIKSDGTEVFGYGLLMSLMTCLKLRELESSEITIEQWDKNANAKVPVDIENFDALCNQTVGVLLQKVLKDNDKYSFNIVGFYSEDGKTASEILDKKDAGSLANKVKYLKDKDERTSDTFAPSPAHAPAAGGFADMADDIPF